MPELTPDSHAGMVDRLRERESWDVLGREVRSCTQCPLHRTRTQAVFYRGSLRPLVVFVGEAPGAEEDRVGLPFVGRAGKRLDQGIAEARIPPSEAGILNLLKCRPPRNRFDSKAADTCRPFLDRQLTWLEPKLLVTLGRSALTRMDPAAPPITTSAGTLRRWQGRPLVPLLHPAATFRSKTFLSRWTQDLLTLREAYASVAPQPL